MSDFRGSEQEQDAEIRKWLNEGYEPTKDPLPSATVHDFDDIDKPIGKTPGDDLKRELEGEDG